MPRPYSSIWSDIFHESIVEHDLRLRSIRGEDTPLINCERIIEVDGVARKNDDMIASHPIAIYLNKLAPKLQQYRRKNKEMIYKRRKLVASSSIDDCYDDDVSYRVVTGLGTCSLVTINPRNRWFKLYERNPQLTSTTSELSIQLYRTIQARRQILDESSEAETMTRGSLIPLNKYQKFDKARIYHRHSWNQVDEGGSFPLVWKKPDPSVWVDDVSGVALRHITLLCRDMICECNKCTTGCPDNTRSKYCDACRMDSMQSFISQATGSFAEGCMLPTYFVRNELNKSIKKSSDFDTMYDSERRVGFNTEIESNIFATIEADNYRPGFLRLRVVGNEQIFHLSENNEFFDSSAQFHIRRLNIEDTFKTYSQTTSTSGPATTSTAYFDLPDIDEVNYFSCSSWPPIAQTWVDRKRQNNWPTKEIIRDIVSKGCRIVHKPHPSSRDPDAEFRFSFSEAELTLFNTLSVDQKKCFVAFKALVKYEVCRLEFETKKDINLSSYSLKTIFLWTCETIPADQWHTTHGWTRCLLYMIDQLYACLKSRTLPGYFIQECNLMDSIEPPQTLFQEIVKLRSNPITYAARFLDSTKCFRHLHFKISERIQDFNEVDLREEIALQRQLIFLQKMMIELDSTRGVRFWEKEARLRIFAKWCLQYSHEIHLTPWQCLTREMTLFDVVHLDIVHGFDVPNNVLLEYVDREWSVEIVCKLASCYSMKTFKREEQKNMIEHSLHFKTLLMIHEAINHKYPSTETIITCVSILMRCKEYEMGARVLEPALRECSHETKSIGCRELYADLFSQKIQNEIQELLTILHVLPLCKYMFQGIRILIWFSISMCYKYIGDDEKTRILPETVEYSNIDISKCPGRYLSALYICFVDA